MKATANGCRRWRELIHADLDGLLLDAADRLALERHLAGCGACREQAVGLAAVQRGLAAIATPALADEALERVLARTSRSPAARWWRRAPWWPARALRPVPASALAVAALAVAALAAWLLLDGGPSPRTLPVGAGPSVVEVQRAAAEARLALGLAGRALQRTEQAAVREVLGEEVSGALRRVPIDWPAPPAGDVPARGKGDET